MMVDLFDELLVLVMMKHTLRLIYINKKKKESFLILTTLAAFDPEHVRNLSIHFCLSFASIAKIKKYLLYKKIQKTNSTS